MTIQPTPLTTSNTTGVTGWSGGFGQLYVNQTGTPATITLTWSPDGIQPPAQIQDGVSIDIATQTIGFKCGSGLVTATLTGGDGTTSVAWGVGITSVTPH